MFLQRLRNKERHFLPDLRPEIRINLGIIQRSEMWKNKTTVQKVNSIRASLPPASEPTAHGTFLLTLIRGWILLQEIVYNHVLFTYLTSLASP